MDVDAFHTKLKVCLQQSEELREAVQEDLNSLEDLGYRPHSPFIWCEIDQMVDSLSKQLGTIDAAVIIGLSKCYIKYAYDYEDSEYPEVRKFIEIAHDADAICDNLRQLCFKTEQVLKPQARPLVACKSDYRKANSQISNVLHNLNATKPDSSFYQLTDHGPTFVG